MACTKLYKLLEQPLKMDEKVLEERLRKPMTMNDMQFGCMQENVQLMPFLFLGGYKKNTLLNQNVVYVFYNYFVEKNFLCKSEALYANPV